MSGKHVHQMNWENTGSKCIY